MTAHRPFPPPPPRDGSATAPAPHIVIFNVKYSPNLGDGLLSECLEAEVRAAAPGVTVISADLAGREGYGAGGRLRHAKLALLELLPGRARQFAAGVALTWAVRRRLAPGWRRLLAPADAVIVGGGNLFADADLNFPIKLQAALAEAARRSLPVAVYGVGVTANWSRRGARLFAAGLAAAAPLLAMVRDERSRIAWDCLLDPAAVPRATITSDPGLLTSLYFPAPPRAGRDMPTVGLGITDPVALRYHGGDASADTLAGWLETLVGALAAQRCRIRLFTNGSPEDRRFLARIEQRLIARAPDAVSVAPGFYRPADLARFVAGCDLVMAHRMHACIAAYSYRIPTIGFVWDVKLKSFFELTGRAGYIIDPAAISAADAAALARAAIAEGIPAARHHELIERARRDVATVVDRLLAVAVPA